MKYIKLTKTDGLDDKVLRINPDKIMKVINYHTRTGVTTYVHTYAGKHYRVAQGANNICVCANQHGDRKDKFPINDDEGTS